MNYANDYTDGVRGTDDRARSGRCGSSARASRRRATVKRAALLAFGVAGVAGLVLAAADVVVAASRSGVASDRRGLVLHGGPEPYGYLGLGELFVFMFFGLVATVGTTYVAVETITGLASWSVGAPSGCVACALLVVNNLRDIPTDTVSGKRTLAVRLGDARTRWLYVAPDRARRSCSSSWRRGVATVGAARPRRAAGRRAAGHRVRGGAAGPALIAVLGETGRLQLAFGLFTTIGLAVGA